MERIAEDRPGVAVLVHAAEEADQRIAQTAATYTIGLPSVGRSSSRVITPEDTDGDPCLSLNRPGIPGDSIS